MWNRKTRRDTLLEFDIMFAIEHSSHRTSGTIYIELLSYKCSNNRPVTIKHQYIIVSRRGSKSNKLIQGRIRSTDNIKMGNGFGH